MGPNANLNGLDYPVSLATYGLTYTVAGTAITWTTAGQYATFMTNYGAPAVNGMVVDTTNQVPYVDVYKRQQPGFARFFEVQTAQLRPYLSSSRSPESTLRANGRGSAKWLKLKAVEGVQVIRNGHCEPYHTTDWSFAGIWRRLRPQNARVLLPCSVVTWGLWTIPLGEKPQGGEDFDNHGFP